MKRFGLLAGAATLSLLAFVSEAPGRVLEFSVVKVESPAFGGKAFGAAGSYDRVWARARIGLDPADPHNREIVDLDLAPRNAQGLVEATTEVEILRPSNAASGSDKLFFEVVNRGRRLAPILFNDGPGKDDLADPTALGNGFLLERGYTIVWAGWQPDAPGGEGRLNLSLPIIPNVTGRSVEEFIFDNTMQTVSATLTYPAAELDPAKATLTVRGQERHARQTPSDLKFTFDGPTKITITRPAGFDAGALYELVYTAKDALPVGAAFAVPRDVVSFLRHERGAANPLADRRFAKAIGFGVSQSGRYMRDFLHLGFNEDESGRVVFEGIMPHVAGGKKSFVNFRFAQPGREVRQHIMHSYPGDQFPFTYPVLADAVSGRTDGIFARCLRSNTCPKLMHSDSEREIYDSRASLVVTDTTGVPIDLPENVRVYLMANTPHFAAFGARPQPVAQCQHPSNALHGGPPMRALLVAMDEWLDGKEPPPSRYPSRRDGTLVTPVPDAVGMPAVPGLRYSGLVNPLAAHDHSTFPPKEGGSYPVLVGRTDADGHTVAGIRVPAIEAPLATHLGFNYRKAGFAEGALCDLVGTTLPFAKTKAERVAAGDPRLSLEERYLSRDDYVKAVDAAARKLVAERLLLDADAKRIVAQAAQAM